MSRGSPKSNDTVLGILTRDSSTRKFRALEAADGKQTPNQQQQQPPPPSRCHSKKFSFLYSLLNARSRQWQAVLFQRVISWVILLDLLSFIFSTEPLLQEPGYEKYRDLFHYMEGFSSSIFLLEYLARLKVCTEKPKHRDHGPFWGRYHYILSTSALIDAAATFPFFLTPLLRGYFRSSRTIVLPRLTYLRFLRLLRLTKTHGAMRATGAVYRVIYYNREILYVASFTCTLLVFGTGVILYYLRPPDLNPDTKGDSAEQFQSILSTMYLSTMMLTGQGMSIYLFDE